MANRTDPTILNPDTYLNHFTPDEAKQFEVSRNVYIAVLGAVACDILSYIPQDVRIIKRCKCSGLVTTVCFALVRFIDLVKMALVVALFTTPVPNCSGVATTASVFSLLSTSATSFLFLRRVQALYSDNRLICWTFAIFWAAISSIPMFSITGAAYRPLADTGYCTVYETKNFFPFSNVMTAAFDTLVFSAISYKVAFQYNRVVPGIEYSWTSSWFSSRTLPVLSKAILQGGQQYYLITFVLNIFAVAFSFGPLVPPMWRVLVSVPTISISACLACRAHRTMVGAYYRDGEDSILPPMEFSDIGTRSNNLQHIARVENCPV